MLSRVVRVMVAAAVLASLMATPVSAQPVDKRTVFTFSGPVAMPGVTLPAGEYLFRLPSPETTRIVQVLSADGTRPYGMFFTIPAERPEPASTPEIRFMETAEGSPMAIKTWWYPGERRGYEFIYPREQARRLATNASQPVLTTQEATTTSEQTNTADLSRVSSSGEETHVSAEATPSAETPRGTVQEGQVASSAIAIQASEIPAVAAAEPLSGRPARTELPKTASVLPIVAVIGTLALLGAASIRYWRTR